jgi:hypothetical protein
VLTIHAYEQTTWVTLQSDRSIGTGETRVLHSVLAEAAARPEPEERQAISCTASTAPASSNRVILLLAAEESVKV